jgi:homoserine kinase type II
VSVFVADVSLPSLDLAVRTVLRRYPSIGPEDRSVALGNHGGFSGARLWWIEAPAGPFCLRAWPPRESSTERLSWIHQLMRQARSAGLDFVPGIANTDQGTSWVAHAGQLWELATWMPGQADFHDRSTSTRLEAACTALARLHDAWREPSPPVGPCPAIGRRLEFARDWLEVIRSGWHPPCAAEAADPVHPWAKRAWPLVYTWIPEVPRALAAWADRPLPLQPCLCDIWHDHVLFDGDRVTGLIDYGSVKIDHVAVDLARLLGSMLPDDAEQRRVGLRAYTRLRPLSSHEEALISVLDVTERVIALGNWLRFLYRDGRVFEDRMAVARHLAQLVERVEKWHQSVVRSP